MNIKTAMLLTPTHTPF